MANQDLCTCSTSSTQVKNKQNNNFTRSIPQQEISPVLQNNNIAMNFQNDNQSNQNISYNFSSLLNERITELSSNNIQSHIDELNQEFGFDFNSILLTRKEKKFLKKKKICKSTSNCSICCSSFKNKEIVRELPCKHKFHYKCLKLWLDKSSCCPLCRFDLKKYCSVKVKEKEQRNSDENITDNYFEEIEKELKLTEIETKEPDLVSNEQLSTDNIIKKYLEEAQMSEIIEIEEENNTESNSGNDFNSIASFDFVDLTKVKQINDNLKQEKNKNKNIFRLDVSFDNLHDELFDFQSKSKMNDSIQFDMNETISVITQRL